MVVLWGGAVSYARGIPVGFKVCWLGPRVEGSGFGAESVTSGLGCRVWALHPHFSVEGAQCTVYGVRFPTTLYGVGFGLTP